jgi:hypothetical protein
LELTVRFEVNSRFEFVFNLFWQAIELFGFAKRLIDCTDAAHIIPKLGGVKDDVRRMVHGVSAALAGAQTSVLSTIRPAFRANLRD